jgi:hypothetical protein
MCHDTYSDVCDLKVMGKLAVSGPLTVTLPAKVAVDEPNWDDVATEIKGLRGTYRNCNDILQSWTFHHTEMSRVGGRVFKQQVVNVGKQFSAELGFKYDVSKALGLTGKFSASFSNSVSVTDGAEQNFEQSATDLDVVLPSQVEKMKIQVITHEWMKKIVPINYHGIVQMDAPLQANLEGVKLLSDVFPDPTDRTFAFSGRVLDSTIWDVLTDNRSRALKPEECAVKEGTLNYEGFGGP